MGRLPPLVSGGVGHPGEIADREIVSAPEGFRVPVGPPNRERSERFVVGLVGSLGVPSLVSDRERSERFGLGWRGCERADRERSERSARELGGGFQGQVDRERSERSAVGLAHRERSERSWCLFGLWSRLTPLGL